MIDTSLGPQDDDLFDSYFNLPNVNRSFKTKRPWTKEKLTRHIDFDGEFLKRCTEVERIDMRIFCGITWNHILYAGIPSFFLLENLSKLTGLTIEAPA